MAQEVLMLALSPTMETGTIVKWHKREGDSIQTGDILCEVETDKATMEYESQNEGTLLKILVGEGQEAEVGQPIAVAGEEGEDISQLVTEGEEAGNRAEQAMTEKKAAVEKKKLPTAEEVRGEGISTSENACAEEGNRPVGSCWIRPRRASHSARSFTGYAVRR